MAAKKLDLLQGTVDMLILKTLELGPRHGYSIAERIEQVSDNVLLVEEGSLYPALHRLAKRGWIQAGVISYTAARRTHEIGIRIALGATRAEVMLSLIRRGMALAITGLLTGAAAAYGLTRLLASYLFGVTPTDPLTFGSVAAVLLAVAFVSCYVPAQRAARVDPVSALRSE